MKPKPPRGSNWRHDRRKALSQNRAPVQSETRILFIESDFDEDYLRGHMRRTGLAAEGTPDAVIRQLLPVVASDLAHEAERLRDIDLESFQSLSIRCAEAANGAALARFLSIPRSLGREIAKNMEFD